MPLTPPSLRPAEGRDARLLFQKRDYMRRWRSVAANRERERTHQRVAQLERKVNLLTCASRTRVCGFCYQRPSVRIIERLIATNRGFRRVFVPYCGVC